ncbi:hypothetical protein [Streptomyces sp. STR69]|uniref:hypothetical protein n=1 Tax=Streptomyces sp. STR69 TaxID=1796942 RepID=UPI0021C93C4D|nr:hypothetical protein [Streptomyces sp. STR69]
MVELNKREDPAGPEPVRSRGRLAFRLVGTVAILPAWCLVNVAAWGAVLLVGDLLELVFAFSESAERRAAKVADRTLRRVRVLPSWCVTWTELRHRGNATASNID